MFDYEVKFLTSDESLHLKNGDFKSYKYETKRRSDECVYDAGKRYYCERRGGLWRAPRPRHIKQLESKLRDRSIVASEWINESLITLVFSSGAIAYLTVKPDTLDVNKILFDRYCVGKLSGQTVAGDINKRLTRSAVCEHSQQGCNHFIRFDKPQILAKGNRFLPRMLREAIEIKKHPNFNREDGWQLPPVWHPVISLIKSHTLHHTVRSQDTVSAFFVLSKSHLLFTHADRIATLISFGKTANSNIPCRIADREPQLQSVELGGGTRRTERRVSWCAYNAGIKILVWSATNAEPAPWSPVLEDHANLHLYQIHGQQVQLIAYHQLENETLVAELSHKRDSTVHIVEQIACHKNGVNLDWIRYDIPSSERVTKLSSIRENVTRVSLPAHARVVRRSSCDTRLLAACIDGSVHILHHTAGLTNSTKAGFIATEVRWAGELLVVADDGGRLQCFDRALSSLHQHTKCLDLAAYFRDGRRMQLLATRNLKIGPVMLVSFTSGPLTLLRIKHPRLLTAWIRAGRTSNAVALLRSLDWEFEGAECLWALNKLVCCALRSGADGESAAQSALGAFLAPAVPHTAAANRFAPPVHDLARKFFHHLLRRGRIEKAMSLAVDLAACDLFVDARWFAARRGLPHLAQEAATLATNLAQADTHSECSESCSQCSSHSYTSEDETSASSEPIKTKPPPLPRVTLPTLMPVPLTQTETISTNSIRPNLHQYLERDNTIWNTEVKDDYTRIKTNGSVKRMDVLYQPGTSKHDSKTIIDVIPRHDERVSSNFRHIYQTELREDTPHTIYRYQSYPNPMNDKAFRNDGPTERVNRTGEKNKVKFSDTVTIAVVSEPPSVSEETARELADSLPLCPPHKYLSAFTPHPPPGTTLDYVEV